MQRVKIGPNSLKTKQCLLRKGQISHLLVLGVLGLRWRRRNFEISCPPSLGFTFSSKKKRKKRKLGGVFKKISRRRKKRKRVELDVLESRSKIWDPNLVCVYILIWLHCCFGCDL